MTYNSAPSPDSSLCDRMTILDSGLTCFGGNDKRGQCDNTAACLIREVKNIISYEPDEEISNEME
jgi:hypothetical protein